MAGLRPRTCICFSLSLKAGKGQCPSSEAVRLKKISLTQGKAKRFYSIKNSISCRGPPTSERTISLLSPLHQCSTHSTRPLLLTPKPDKRHCKKNTDRHLLLIEIQKIINKILANWHQQHRTYEKKLYTMTKGDLFQKCKFGLTSKNQSKMKW